MDGLIVITTLKFCTKILMRNGTMLLTNCLKKDSKVLINHMILCRLCIIVVTLSYQTRLKPLGRNLLLSTRELMFSKSFLFCILLNVFEIRFKASSISKPSSIDIFEIKSRYSKYCTKTGSICLELTYRFKVLTPSLKPIETSTCNDNADQNLYFLSRRKCDGFNDCLNGADEAYDNCAKSGNFIVFESSPSQPFWLNTLESKIIWWAKFSQCLSVGRYQFKNQFRAFKLFLFPINTRLLLTSRNDSKVTGEWRFCVYGFFLLSKSR